MNKMFNPILSTSMRYAEDSSACKLFIEFKDVEHLKDIWLISLAKRVVTCPMIVDSRDSIIKGRAYPK